MKNPIDKDKVVEHPGLLAYPHTVGSIVVKPEDRGKIKSRALSAMQEQTAVQLKQIQRQVETLLQQANDIRSRVDVSEKIYQAEISFEPLIGSVYHLYENEGRYKLMLVAPSEWGASKSKNLVYISTVKLLSDHTWQILESYEF